MPDSAPAAFAALDALGFALFEREATGELRLAGSPPAWLRGLWPQVESGSALPITDASPFLENFLVDAEACWSAGGDRATSGPWIERDATGADVPIEATALNAGGRALLLIERLGEVFDAKKVVLQKARENVIAYQRLNAEMLKKELLLYCVAEDMTASLANGITALRLIEAEQDPTKAQLLLGLAARALETQQGLIHKVLNVYADDLKGFYGRSRNNSAGADLRAVVRAAAAEVTPQFAEKGVRLSAPEYAGGPLTTADDAAHLQRVVANLLENALQATPVGREAAVVLDEIEDYAIVRVDDGGTPADCNIPAHLFASFGPANPRPEPAQMRLQFCRIAVENSGGQIGCELRPGGGNRFWIRVPKAPRAS